MAHNMYDAIIVGMGPAGSTLAGALCRRGHSVVAFDKQTHPRYKVCGGALSARIDNILEPDVHAVVERTIFNVQFTYGQAAAHEVHSPDPIVYMTMRDRLDHLLLQKAASAGAEVHQNEGVVDFVEHEDGIEAVTEQGRYRGRVLIGADGANSRVAQRFFASRTVKRIPALESEISMSDTHAGPDGDTLLIDFGSTTKGYGWAFPKQACLSIGVAEFLGKSSKPRDAFARFLTGNPTIAQLSVPAPAGHPIPLFTPRYWFGPACRAGSLVSNRTVLVGDAGHLVDPLFGEGIYFAVQSALLAAETIAAHLRDASVSLRDYERAVDRTIGRDLRIAARLVRVMYAIPHLLHRFAGTPFPAAFQELLGLYCHVLQGKESYQSLLKPTTSLTRLMQTHKVRMVRRRDSSRV